MQEAVKIDIHTEEASNTPLPQTQEVSERHHPQSNESKETQGEKWSNEERTFLKQVYIVASSIAVITVFTGLLVIAINGWSIFTCKDKGLDYVGGWYTLFTILIIALILLACIMYMTRAHDVKPGFMKKRVTLHVLPWWQSFPYFPFPCGYYQCYSLMENLHPLVRVH
jgi:uncharacterized membrane protein